MPRKHPQPFFRAARDCWYVRAGEGRVVMPRSESKGKRSARVIYLTDEAAAIVGPLCESRPSGPIFLNSGGRPWTKDSINCMFTRLERRMGRRFHLGAFRKGWATEALKNGVDVLTAAHLMGHSNANMLAKHYAKMQADPAFMAGAARRARGDGTASRAGTPASDQSGQGQGAPPPSPGPGPCPPGTPGDGPP